MSYRAPSSPDEPADQELSAIQKLQGRIKFVQLLVVIPLILGSVVLGAVLYPVLRDFQLERSGGHILWVTASMAMMPTFGAAIVLAPRIARAVVARFLPQWRRELARAHDLDLALFEETTRFLD